jgi:hypothetical protein
MHRSIRLVGGVVTAALTTAGAVALAQPTQAASGASAAAASVKRPIDCPTAYPIAKVTKGLKATGFTVESATTPAPFTATIIGRITDGIEPGTDMIMAKISSPAVTRAHGIWAGISGSPVYSSDGRLIGSVSYGLAANSDIAGLTPGAALLPVLGGVGAAKASLAGPRRVAVPRAQVQALVAAGASSADAGAGFTRIPLPLTLSGKPSKAILDAVKAIPDVRLVQSAARASSTPAKTSQIHAGGNFVAAISFGDASAYAAGTTTVVCKGKAVAFGHPFLWTGHASYSAHPASAVYVQPDPLFGAFKVVNPGGPVGLVDTDRTTGIRAVLGAKLTNTVAVTSSFTVGTHAAVKGTTVVVDQTFTGPAAEFHVFLNATKALGYAGGGSGTVTFTIKGVRANGKAFSVTRKDVYADTGDLPDAIGLGVEKFIDPLEGQTFENLRLTSVSVTGTLQTTVHRYTVAKVEARQGSTWVTPGNAPLAAKAGSTLALRVTLAPYKGLGTRPVVPLTLSVPASAAGSSAGLELTAGPTDPDTSGAGSVDDILKALAASHSNDQLVARLVNTDTGATLGSVSKHVGTAIAGYGNGWTVNVS